MCSPDPFVLQTYKSIMCFVTSWVVLFLGVDFEYTNWGIVSGILWVSGGVCGIFGIRNAGLAVSVGTWVSFISRKLWDYQAILVVTNNYTLS